MMSFIKKALGSAGVTFAATTMIYGDAQYADLGMTVVDAKWLEMILPLVVGVVYPLVSDRWPWMASAFKWVLGKFKGGSSNAQRLLELLNKMEIEAVHSGCNQKLADCQRFRGLALERLKHEG